MSLEVEAGSLQRGNITYFPVAPGRVEFSHRIAPPHSRQRPQVVAVELPGKLGTRTCAPSARLPQMSVIVYPDPLNDERAIYVPVEPADPYTEAVRTGAEIGAEIVFLEPDHGERPHLPDTYPDAYSVRRIGLEAYVNAYRLQPQPRTDETAEHAAGIAWKLQGADPTAAGACGCFAESARPDARRHGSVRRNSRRALRGFQDIQLVNPHPDCLAEITIEYPYLQDRYEFYRIDTMDERLIDKPHAQFESAARSRGRVRAQHGREDGALASPPALRATRATSRRSTANSWRARSISRLRRSVASSTITLDTKSGRRRTAIRRSRPRSELETVNLSGEEIWLNTKRRCGSAAACRGPSSG